MTVKREAIQPEAIQFSDSGAIPNSPLPLLLYRQVWSPPGGRSQSEDLARQIEDTFLENDWRGLWRNGVFPYHHYHSTSHEVLAVYSGWAVVLFGGEPGSQVEVSPGDVVVIPAGVGHKLIRASGDFSVIGGYPQGRSWDMCYGKPEERPAADRRIAEVPLPQTDPVTGPDGPLRALWTDNR